jgi:hypothetical protein
MPIAVESFKAIPYLKAEHLGDGRTVKLMPLWDGEIWRLWLDTPRGLMEARMVDAVEGDYVAKTPAKQSDLFIPFVHLMWQCASWPEICPLINAISDDFHNMGTSVAKLRHSFDSRANLPPGSASRFAHTELEYVVMLCRSVFDLLQEIVSILWEKKVHLHDHGAERYRKGSKLPMTFSTLVLRDKRQAKSAVEIENKYGLPKLLAAKYADLATFFSQLRDVRDDVIHGRRSIGHIYETERGFCVSPKTAPFSSFEGWRPEHYFSENIVSLTPWIANTILQTIQACSSLMSTFASVIEMPPEIAPGYRIFVRGPHNEALAGLLNVHSGGSAWWDGSPLKPT